MPDCSAKVCKFLPQSRMRRIKRIIRLKPLRLKCSWQKYKDINIEQTSQTLNRAKQITDKSFINKSLQRGKKHFYSLMYYSFNEILNILLISKMWLFF